jgi:hypothetical protein
LEATVTFGGAKVTVFNGLAFLLTLDSCAPCP